MGFSNQEAINLNFASLAAGVIDANSAAVWFEKQFGFSFILGADTVWTQTSSIPAAGTLTVARSNAAANPTIIEDLSQATDAKRLTLIAGTNYSTFACYDTYNDPTSGLLKNWLLPQLVPQTSGAPSNGYSIQLYDGDPNAGGTLITTTDGQTGTGSSKQVGWIYNYALGLLLVSDDFYTRTGITASAFNPYVVGFRYIGGTAGSGSGTIGGSIADTQVAYGSGTDTIQGAADFIYDDTVKVLEVEKIKTQVVIQVHNATGSTIGAGAAVYVSADGSSIPEVDLADSSDSAKMPSVGIVPNAINTGNNGYAVLTGTINGLDGSAGNTVFDSTIVVGDVGKTLYVSPTNPGRLTITKPTGASELIQNVGRIVDLNGNNVKIAVNNIGRTNDVPNSFSTTGEIDAGSLTVNSAYSFPTSDGTDGQVLVTDGAGTLTFQNPKNSYSTVVADETIAEGAIVRFVTSSDVGLTPGRVVNANATTEEDGDLVGIASSAAAAQGDSITMVTSGEANVLFASAPPSTDNGKQVYLSTTDGTATLTAPSSSGNLIIRLGKLKGANGSTTTPSVILHIQLMTTIG
jgi:hypothetical protein